jgi:GNAT superfamily N-acetyltransferase
VSPLIRQARPDDAAAAVALRAKVFPYLVRGVESTRQGLAEAPPEEQRATFAAELDGRLIGWASAYRNISTSEPGVGEISLLHVDPEHRGQGVGGALLAASLEHLERIGARRARAWAQEASAGFAQRHGFQLGSRARCSRLDLARPLPEVSPRTGVQLVPVGELAARQLYEADLAATADEPGDVPTGQVSYPAWRHDIWDNPDLDKELSTAVLLDGTVVAFSLAVRDGLRIWSDMTATVPQHRGAGLALLAKTVTLRRAADRGLSAAYTSNDETNAPMLAINRRLGYELVATQFSCLAGLPAGVGDGSD